MLRGNKRTPIWIIVSSIFFYLLSRFGDNLFGSFYENYIEPGLLRKIDIVLSWKDVFNENGEIIAQRPDRFFQVDVLLLIVLFVVFVSAGVLIGQLFSKSDIIRDHNRNVLVKAMRTLVDDNEYIQAVQVYHFKNEKKNGYRRITIDYIDSQLDNDLDLNAVIHEEFHIEERKYKTIKSFAKKYEQFEKSRRQSVFQNAKQSIAPLLASLQNEIQGLELHEATEKHCVDYAIYKGIKCYLGEEEWYDPIPGCDPEVCRVIRDTRKTRFLPAILMQVEFTFRNDRSPLKNDRIYLTFSPEEEFLPKGFKKTLMVLTMSYQTIKEKYVDLNIEAIVQNVYDQLQDALNSEKGS